ncbi:c-type cytochrome [Diaphorobacter aerolatus]|uniref:c-type cytochrome n=1 Tax=Diaphorobacter aerolatus TaxID=1288495 RepID=UPI00384FE5AB
MVKFLRTLSFPAFALCALAAFNAQAQLAQAPDFASKAHDPDGMAVRTLACTTCHGAQGKSTSSGYFPRLAGKPAGYLYNQLLNFRDGRRAYPTMSYLLENLTDEYLREIAEHFAVLEVPYPAPLPASESASVLEHGRKLVFEGDAARSLPACVQCHGKAMTGVAPFVPGLLGLPRDYLNGQLGAWQSGKRHAQQPDCMAAIARQMQPEDVSAVSAWLAAQPVPDGGKPVAAHAQALPMRCGGVEVAK